MNDKTNLLDAKEYLVTKPTTDVKIINPNNENIIEDTVPKTIYKDPADESKELIATNIYSGNVIVKLQGYDEENASYTTEEFASTTISYDDLVNGNFTMTNPKDILKECIKVVLVSYSPNCTFPIMGDPIVV